MSNRRDDWFAKQVAREAARVANKQKRDAELGPAIQKMMFPNSIDQQAADIADFVQKAQPALTPPYRLGRGRKGKR